MSGRGTEGYYNPPRTTTSHDSALLLWTAYPIPRQELAQIVGIHWYYHIIVRVLYEYGGITPPSSWRGIDIVVLWTMYSSLHSYCNIMPYCFTGSTNSIDVVVCYRADTTENVGCTSRFLLQRYDKAGEAGASFSSVRVSPLSLHGTVQQWYLQYWICVCYVMSSSYQISWFEHSVCSMYWGVHYIS